jgi:23S rRNA (uridine2552-2'-O)-methyltransferase
MPKPYTPNDKWSRRAAEEGYRARSVYKLQELNEKFRILKSGMTVLDLGAAPGSWLQYAAHTIGPKGTAIGIDLQEIEPIEGVEHLYQADITDMAAVEKILAKADKTEVGAVISDLAPKTSGIKDVDQWRSIELSEAVVEVADRFLKPGGYCVMKVFRGADFDEFYGKLKNNWKQVKLQHTKASRDRSREVYIVMRKPAEGRK